MMRPWAAATTDGSAAMHARLSVMTFMTRMGVNKSELIERGFL